VEGDRGVGGSPGEKEAGEEGVGGGIPDVGGSGRDRENYMQHCIIFPKSKKSQKGGSPKK